MRISKNRIDLEGARLDNAVINNSTLSGTTAATQADQETGTSTTVAVTPGRQHFHPGHPKCWASISVSAGVPTLQTSYNITSIADTDVGKCAVTIETDFSSAGWCALVGGQEGDMCGVDNSAAPLAGSCSLQNRNGAGAYADPTYYFFAGFGDQA